MGMSTKEIGSKTKLMGKALTSILMELSTLGCGKKTNRTGLVLKFGQMERNMKGITKMERNLDEESFNEQMGVCTKGNFKTTVSMVMALINEAKEEFI